MEEKKVCEICGYKDRKNSNRILSTVYINIAKPNYEVLEVIYSKEAIMCNICLDTMTYNINEYFVLNEEE